ncbi:hypothetical protein V6N13_070956 [Hibiscus sabdariffa]|uniref:Uncharacterized protein n=1 Tax=Hibiscus sabdariffa TaxID=183260 RepID=A0ABR2TFT3_9ROSI
MEESRSLSPGPTDAARVPRGRLPLLFNCPGHVHLDGEATSEGSPAQHTWNYLYLLRGMRFLFMGTVTIYCDERRIWTHEVRATLLFYYLKLASISILSRKTLVSSDIPSSNQITILRHWLVNAPT